MIGLVVLLVGILGGIVAFYAFYSLVPRINSTNTEKVTEKQVYIEKSATIDAVKVVSQNLVTFLTKEQIDGLAGKDGKLEKECFSGSVDCQRVGAILTSDGLVISGTNLDEKDLPNWGALDVDGNRYRVFFVGRLGGSEIYQLVKSSEINSAPDQRSTFLNVKPVLLADSSIVEVGQEVIGVESFLSDNLKMSNGLVSRKLDEKGSVRSIDAEFMPVWLGFSGQVAGGLVFDLSGELLTVRPEKTGDSLSVEQVKAFLTRYSANKKNFEAVNLGVKCLDLDKASAMQLGYKVDYGCVVLEGLSGSGAIIAGGVTKKSAAEKAGVKAGDVILEVDDNSLLNASLGQLMLAKVAGEKVHLLVLRDGKTSDLTVEL